jgi:lipocalin
MLLLLLLIFTQIYLCRTEVPDVISSININNYIGHWLQVYYSPTNVFFQGYGTCITADYGILENGDINVINTQLNKNKEIEQITGYGYYKNLSEPGKLTVHLEGVPVDAPYWIIKLGEVNDDKYQYSIVTSPSGISLWVLARDIDEFNKLYSKEVTDFLNQYNFNYKTVSQDNCHYN